MKKTINNFTEFKRVVLRTKNDVFFSDYGFYYQTKKCSFFYSCRSLVDRLQVYRFLRENQIKHYKLDEFL